ncbi:MAG: hypothetical protein KDE31_12305, partial [Caldilineaceae bacterium]|nr:hypothetical protein [Caldilineaceae bacterium]
KRYSSGMYVRLAFAVAAHLEPEILLVDEVLAVGDAAFQKKCLGKMGDVAREGRTVLFVSHNMAAVENLCTRAAVLDGGTVVTFGDVEPTITTYLSQTSDLRQPVQKVSGPATLILQIAGKDGSKTDTIQTGEELTLRLDLTVSRPVSRAGVGVGIADVHGTRILTFHTHYQFIGSWAVQERCVCTIGWPES